MLFQFRDEDIKILEQLKTVIRNVVKTEDANGPCNITITKRGRSDPAVMNKNLQSHETAAENAALGSM